MNYRSVSLFSAIALATIFADYAHCQLYKWEDPNGNTYYSDTPPKDPEARDVAEQAYPDLITQGQPLTSPQVQKEEKASGPQSPPSIGPFDPSLHNACISRVESDSGDVLTLDNGALVEINYQFVGFLGFYPDGLIFFRNGGWNIWIKGKKVFTVELLQAPVICRAPTVYLIDSVTANGAVIVDNIAYSPPSQHTPFSFLMTVPHQDCADWQKGDHVVLYNGTSFDSCHPNRLFSSVYTKDDAFTLINLDREKNCELYCR